MRIAAGVFLIIVAIINLLAAFGYLAGGAVVSGAGELSQAMQEQAAANGSVTPEAQAEFDAAMDEAPSGGGMMALGAFLAVLAIMQIVGAIQAFRTKGAMLVMVVGGLSIIGEIWGAVMSSFGLTQILGFAAGILAIVAGLGIKKAAEGGGAAPAAPPAA